MALRLGILKSSSRNSTYMLGLRRWDHVQSLPLPLVGSLQPTISSPLSVLPESDPRPDNNSGFRFALGFPSFFSLGESMELMAVPKKKVSPHKRGIRNGPRALKPTPVIIRCRSCGRVKLPHFYCCSGDRGKISEQAQQSRLAAGPVLCLQSS